MKSVSSNLRIGEKTFCENFGVRHEKSYLSTVNGFKGYKMSTKSHISLTNKSALIWHQFNYCFVWGFYEKSGSIVDYDEE